MAILVSNIVAQFGSANSISKSPRNRKKYKVAPQRLLCELTAVDGSSLLTELLYMLCIIFSVGFSLRLLNGSYPFPKYYKKNVSPLLNCWHRLKGTVALREDG